MERLQEIIHSRSLTLFAQIDHSGEARRVGLTMQEAHVLIFGNPKGGTPVMLAAPSSALDLPLKVLIAQDASGKVWLSYNAAEYLAERHTIPGDLVENIAGIRALVQAGVAP